MGKHALAYSLGWVPSGYASLYIHVYVLKKFDPKFSRSPDAAFQVGLYSGTLATIIMTLLLVAGLLTREGWSERWPRPRTWIISLLVGVASPWIGELIGVGALLVPFLLAWLLPSRPSEY